MSEYPEFLRLEFLGVRNWKWLAIVVVFCVLYFVRKFLIWIGHKIRTNQPKLQNNTFFNCFLSQEIEKPVSWVIVSALAIATVEYLELPDSLTKYLFWLIKILLTYNVIRICYMAAEAFGESLIEWSRESENHFDDQLAPFANKTLKVVVVVVGVLIGLQNFGVNVTALLAGLGIGGVALAFAAQDTVSNVFGTITIILDRPFKLSDHIKIGDTEGIVEEVGFRSTRIRTLYNSVVSLPNSVVAKEKIDNLSLRNGWIRFRHILGFTYGADLKQVKQYCEDLRYQFQQERNIDKDRIAVNFSGFGDSSLNVLVSVHYEALPTDNQALIETKYLELIEQVAKQNKLEFAFPTRTLFVQNK